MLSKNKIKYIQALSLKKFRDKYGVFVAEGEKLVQELLPFFKAEMLVVQQNDAGEYPAGEAEVLTVTSGEMKKISNLQSARNVLAVFYKPAGILEVSEIRNSLTLALDGIQDPGNLGTILRIADWFGIANVVCSPDTVDVFNPKVVQATMGALARVKVHYTPLAEFLSQAKVPVYGTFLEGENLYQTQLDSHGIILMGNEGKGIREEPAKYVSKKLFIPPFPPHAQNVESLNVGVATAILCAEFRRPSVP